MSDLLWVVLPALFCIILWFSHPPLFKVKAPMCNSFIHFTSHHNAQKIIESGCLLGSRAGLFFPFNCLLGNHIWTYPYINLETVLRAHKRVLKLKKARKNPEVFSVCLKITISNSEDFKKLYTRKLLIRDNVMTFRTNILKPDKIEIIQEW